MKTQKMFYLSVDVVQALNGYNINMSELVERLLRKHIASLIDEESKKLQELKKKKEQEEKEILDLMERLKCKRELAIKLIEEQKERDKKLLFNGKQVEEILDNGRTETNMEQNKV